MKAIWHERQQILTILDELEQQKLMSNLIELLNKYFAVQALGMSLLHWFWQEAGIAVLSELHGFVYFSTPSEPFALAGIQLTSYDKMNPAPAPDFLIYPVTTH